MNLTVSNAQIPLNELNKSRGMLMRNLFGKEKRINKCRGRIKGFDGKGGYRIPKQRKNDIGNNIIFNLVYYSKWLQIAIHCSS
jgi:hypothetical protein